MRKSLRLSSTGLTAFTKDPEPVVKTFGTRFSLSSFVKRVQRLTAEQRSAISCTGLGSLLLIPNHSLNRVFLTELMEAWDSKRRAFTVGSAEIEMSLLDVALILGIPVVGNHVALTEEEEPFSDLEDQYGAAIGRRKVAMSSLEARLDSIGEVVSEDFVRSFLLYTIGTFLCSNDGKVDSRYLFFLRDLNEVSKFAWGAAVVQDLCLWLDKRKQNNVQYVGGCLIFLQTWSYEHFDIARPQLQDDDMTFPRVCRWDHSKSHPRQRGSSRFKDLHDDQVVWKLQPTSGELQIEIVKDALEFLGDDKEFQKAENCSANTSSTVPGVDSELQLSICSKVQREDESHFENQVVEDTPTSLSTCAKEHREEEINLESLIVENTPPNINICDRVHEEQEMNCENLVVVDTPSNSSNADTPPNFSIRRRTLREQKVNHENLIVVDTDSNSSIADEVGREEEFHGEKLLGEDHSTELVVVDAPSILSIADTPPNFSIRRREDGQNLIVDGTPPKPIFYDDDLMKKNIMLEEENAELMKKITQLDIHRQQNGELKQELELLREENRFLRLSISRFGDQLDRHILDFETNMSE